MAYLGRTGALATLSRKYPCHPFASVMPYALDELGQPLMLISSMAMHTQNLRPIRARVCSSPGQSRVPARKSRAIRSRRPDSR